MRLFPIVCLFACLAVPASADSTADSSAAGTKHWVDLRDHPVDYSRFETRRKENITANGTGVSGSLALGFVARTELGTYPIIEDAKLKAAVEKMIGKLIPPAITPPHFEVVLVDDLGIHFSLAALPPEQRDDELEEMSKSLSSDYRVEATRGGGIILSLATLHATKTPDELNFLLGHEISHILLDHFKNEEREKAIRELASVGMMVGLVAAHQNNNAAKTAIEAGLGASLANTLLARQWDRDEEREADEMGSELLVEFGHYSPQGAYSVLQELDDEEQRQNKALDQLCGPEDAGARFLKNMLGGIVKQQGTDPNNPACAVRKDLFADLFKSHPSPADRLANLKAYQLKFYPNDQSRPVTYFSDSKGRHVDNFVAFASPNGDANRLAEAYQGLDAVRDRDLPLARTIERRLGDRGAKENLVPVLMLHVAVALADHKRSDAIKYLEFTTKAPQVYTEAFELLTEMYETDKHWKDAARVIRIWGARSGSPVPFYPRLIADLREAGSKDEMQTELDACRQVSESEIAQACENAALPPPPPPPDASKSGGSK